MAVVRVDDGSLQVDSWPNSVIANGFPIMTHRKHCYCHYDYYYFLTYLQLLLFYVILLTWSGFLDRY